MYTYVIESEDKKMIQDIISFYSLPSTILKPNKHTKINACFSYYNTSLVHNPELVMENAIILAKKNGFDVLNCLDILENERTIEHNNFRKGSGSLHYYLYNYSLNMLKQNEVGIVLV